MNFLSKIVVTVWIGIGSLFGYHAPSIQPSVVTLGDYNPTGGQTYRLQSSISTTQNTVTLTSFKEPISNIKYTMSYLNSVIEYGTLDPQNTSSKEFISFTGITQNNDGTATLTGVSRGLGFSYPFTASTTLASPHSGQSIFIISNPPQLYNQYWNLNNISTSTNIGIFSSTTPPRYDSVAGQAGCNPIATTSELASITYVNCVALAGASNATESGKGIVELATGIEQASSTSLGSTNASVVLQGKNSTSSPTRSCDGFTNVVGSLIIFIASNDGKLNSNWIGTSTAYTYNWSAANVFTASTTIFANTSNKLSLNALSYAFPTARGASSTVLTENGSGTLIWLQPQIIPLLSTSTPSALPGSTSATTTITSLTLPANTLNGTSQSLRIKVLVFNDSSGNNTCHFNVAFGTGLASTTIGYAALSNRPSWGEMNVFLNATTTSSELGISQSTEIDNSSLQSAVVQGAQPNVNYLFSGFATVPLTAQSYLAFSGRTPGSSVCGISGITVEKLSN